jgi:amidase
VCGGGGDGGELIRRDGAEQGLMWISCYSIVSPAEKAGIIGLKPTHNVLSSDGLIHASQRLDTVGLLTRTVSDAADILLELMSRSNQHDVSAKTKLIKNITPSCSKMSLSTMRIGIPWSLRGLTILSLPKREAFRHVLTALQRAGATLVHDVHIPGAAETEALTPAQKSIILDTDMENLHQHLPLLPRHKSPKHTQPPRPHRLH